MLIANRPPLRLNPRGGVFLSGLRGLGDIGCGAQNGQPYSTSLVTTSPNLCADGSRPTQGPYFNNSDVNPAMWWICGQATPCSAVHGTSASTGTPPVAGASGCGSANGVPVASQPSSGFCVDGSMPTQGPYWNGGSGWWWTCGPANTPCSANKLAPANSCGSANGVATAVQPANGLCSNGAPSSGPYWNGGSGWWWTCGDTPCSAAKLQIITPPVITPPSGNPPPSGGGQPILPPSGGVNPNTGSSTGGSSSGSSSGSGSQQAAGCGSGSISIGGSCIPFWGIGLGALVLVMAVGKR
jgi:hypothetical protein